MSETLDPAPPDPSPAIIVIGDVVDFSKMDGGEQRRVVHRLWEHLRTHDFLSKPDLNTVCNGTGDGALLVFPRQREGVRYRQAMDFAVQLIEHMRQSTPPALLRVGVHFGNYHLMDIPTLGRQAVGTGLNTCSRLAGVGDGGQIIVSEKFFREWLGEDASIVQSFEPSDDRPYVIYVKHGVPQQVRVYRAEGGKGPLPRRLEALRVVEAAIKRILSDIEFRLSDVLSQWDPELTPHRVSARVSIFAKQPLDLSEDLVSTEFRYHRARKYLQHSKSRYSTKSRGSGPAGRAFVAQKPQCLRNLPEYDTHRKKYISRLVKEWGMTAHAVEDWQVKSRSFLTFSFGIPEVPEADGVVCIDMADPLQGLTNEFMRQVGEKLASQFRDALAGFWRLRTQS